VSKSWNRMETWLTLVVAGVGLVVLGVAGLWVYVSATAPTLHPNAQDVTSVASGTPERQWAGAIEQARPLVRAALAEQNLPGVSVAVGAGGTLVWAEGFGWANLENKVPVSPETRFRIGTVSTALTSAAVGLLLEKARLKLDEKIQTYVPEFTEQQFPATLRQVMAHVAGVRNDGGDEGPLFGQRCDRPVEALQHFDSALRFEPGTQYRYSNFGWILVSAAVEAVADQPFLAFMHRQIFEPLGMRHTDADIATEPGPDLATSYFPRFGADPRYGPDLMRPIDLSCYAGSSAFLSTPSDLVRFALAFNSGKLLQPDTVKMFQTSQRLASGEETGYGLGWDIETVALAGEQTRWVGHDGMVLGGMVASLMTFPDRGLVVSVTANTSYADTELLALKIAQAFAEQRNNPARN
jgi:serine beta-lactamase-like protein LACTB, mitochondrial